MPQTGSDVLYGHLIASTVMTLGVCQGYSLTASFLYTDKRVAQSLCHSRASCVHRWAISSLTKRMKNHFKRGVVMVAWPI